LEIYELEKKPLIGNSFNNHYTINYSKTILNWPR